MIYILVTVRIGCYTSSYELCSVTAHNIRIWKYSNLNSVIRGQFQKTHNKETYQQFLNRNNFPVQH